MRTIRLVVFNEEYWGTGLIYSQNLLPLQSLKDKYDVRVELISFTSIPMLFLKRGNIKETRERLNKEGIQVRDFPILYYPTRFLLPYWFLLPYLFLNVFIYIIWLSIMDKKQDVVYNLRSYQPALAFYWLYGHKDKLVFDPRTDFVEEKVNAGQFKRGGVTARYWRKMEGKFVKSFKKTIVISDPFKDNLISFHKVDPSKIVVLYNPINYSHFSVAKEKHEGYVFLYTGSIGGWNKLENYLSIFMMFNKHYPNSKFVVCTSATRDKIEATIGNSKYSVIAGKVEVHYNVPYDVLPSIYAQCDYGFQIMKKRDSRVGVKFIEYIAAGIIPIVSKNVLGAAVLVDKYGMGIVIDDDDSESIICNKIRDASSINRESDTFSVFRALTDTACISERIKVIYVEDEI